MLRQSINHKSYHRRVASLSHAIKKANRVNRPLNNSIHFHMIYHNHPDNMLASCSREMLRLLGMIDEKSQKRLEHQECVTDGQMYS